MFLRMWSYVCFAQVSTGTPSLDNGSAESAAADSVDPPQKRPRESVEQVRRKRRGKDRRLLSLKLLTQLLQKSVNLRVKNVLSVCVLYIGLHDINIIVIL